MRRSIKLSYLSDKWSYNRKPISLAQCKDWKPQKNIPFFIVTVCKKPLCLECLENA